jgi:hypothetical protein
MKNTTLVAITFLLFLAFSDVSNSEIRVTAKQIKTLGDSLFTTLAPNGMFSGMECTNIDTLGKSNLWILFYQYFDTVDFKNSKTYYFKGKDGQISMDSCKGPICGLSAIYASWIDSDSAMSIAEQSGGAAIRKQYPSCIIKARLYGWDAPPFYTEWKIEYVCPDSVRTYRIDAHSGKQIVTDVPADQFVPLSATLYPNYPNPFNPSTTISFDLSSRVFVSLKVFNSVGQEILTLVSQELSSGHYSREFNGSEYPSGVYYCRLQAGAFTDTKKFILLK